MKNKTAVLLLSGGIDSTTLLAKLSNEDYSIIAISFNYGQKHTIELAYAKKNAKKYNVKSHHIIQLDKNLFQTSALVNKNLEITDFKKSNLPTGNVNVYVPFRNLLFISTALSLAESFNSQEVYLAFNKEDRNNFWDCTPDFVTQLNTISLSNTLIKIKTPFINWPKSEVIRLAKTLNVNLEDTITCYQPKNEIECGVCLSCLTKIDAFKKLEEKS